MDRGRRRFVGVDKTAATVGENSVGDPGRLHDVEKSSDIACMHDAHVCVCAGVECLAEHALLCWLASENELFPRTNIFARRGYRDTTMTCTP